MNDYVTQQAKKEIIESQIPGYNYAHDASTIFGVGGATDAQKLNSYKLYTQKLQANYKVLKEEQIQLNKKYKAQNVQLSQLASEKYKLEIKSNLLEQDVQQWKSKFQDSQNKYQTVKNQHAVLNYTISLYQKQVTVLQAEIKTLKNQISSQSTELTVKRCAEGEGEMCVCSGMVYYGEKYNRTDTSAAKGVLTFEQMLATPYLIKDMTHGGLMIQCSFNYIKNKGEHINQSAAKHPKQCFCDESAKHQNWEF